MHFSNTPVVLAAATAFSLVSAVNITPTTDANTLAKALLGPGIKLTSATFQGYDGGSGTFTGGPQGVPDAIVLTTGDVTHPNPPSSEGLAQNVPGFARCDALSGGTSYDAAVLTLQVELQSGYGGFSSKFVFATDEYPEYVGSQFNDVFGIWVDGTQIAFDNKNSPITVNGPFFKSGEVLTPPGSGTTYGGSSQLLQAGYASTAGSHTVEIAVCDIADRIRDSAVFLTLSGCTDAAACNNGTTVASNSTTTPSGNSTGYYTSTTPAPTATGGNNGGQCSVMSSTYYTTIVQSSVSTYTTCPATTPNPFTQYTQTLTSTPGIPYPTSAPGVYYSITPGYPAPSAGYSQPNISAPAAFTGQAPSVVTSSTVFLASLVGMLVLGPALFL